MLQWSEKTWSENFDLHVKNLHDIDYQDLAELCLRLTKISDSDEKRIGGNPSLNLDIQWLTEFGPCIRTEIMTV